MPAWLREKAEAIARGKRRADAPARRRGASFQGRRRPQQKKRQTGIGGGKMQPLAGFQIERVDQAGDGGGRRRTHRFLHGPQGFLAVRGLDHDQAGRIETERVETMTMQPAMGAVGPQPIGGQDKDDLFPPPTRVALARARVQACWGRVGWGVGRRSRNRRRLRVTSRPPPLPTRGRGKE